MRNKIFISHATPDDNDFTKWLALKLIALGYDVWCDILFLDKGVDFWSAIEKEIRFNTARFLTVSSTSSNHRQGVLKELAVAEKVKRLLKDESFIIPLAIDEKLSYDDINIDIVRLNAIDFKKSWAAGLKDLLEALEKQNVPKNAPDPDRSNELFQQIFLHNRGVVQENDVYDSNWFPLLAFPDELCFHDFDYRIPRGTELNSLPFPAIPYNGYLCTFAWEYDFINQFPKTETYENSKTVRISTSELLSGRLQSEFIKNSVGQRLIVQIINKAFELRMAEKGLRSYQMSHTLGFWLEKGALKNDKVGRIKLVGKQLSKNWHFGISGSAKLYPSPVLAIASHIYFTSDGTVLIEKDSLQHAARRRQGKNWWNNEWKTKLLSIFNYLSDDEYSFYLKVGSDERIQVASKPLRFLSPVSYLIPEKNVLAEEVEINSIGSSVEEAEEE